MSSLPKAAGSKIRIKFTDDITSNMSECPAGAFSVLGDERTFPWGDLVEREYAVESVEMYPLVVFHDDDFAEGTLTDVENTESGLVLEQELEVLETFTANGTFTVPTGVESVNVLVVGGGGAGGWRGGNEGGGGGGGAGGLVLEESVSVTPDEEISVTVGAGGSPVSEDNGQDGGNSVFASSTSVTATGGGGGARFDKNGNTGGSGGGAAARRSTDTGDGGAGTVGQGHKGGDRVGIWSSPDGGGAGGGGADGPGSDNVQGDTASGGAGENLSSLLGTEVGNSGVFASGGDGGPPTGVSGATSHGSANTGDGGSGGGSSSSPAPGSGGSGIVVVYTGPEYPSTGNRISPSEALATYPNDIRIRWDEIVPTDTSITIETAVTGETMGTPDTPSETAEVQTLYLGGATGGTYDLGITGNMATLNHNDSAATIETALEGIFGTDRVSVAVDTDYTITFDTIVRDSDLAVDFTSLTDATSPTLTVTTAYDSGDWAEQTDAALIDNIPAGDLADQHLWVRQTLETTNDEVTPTLEALWLEEGEADGTSILITMEPVNYEEPDGGLFSNVVGNLTVDYDDAVGTLAGAGGAVVSFNQAFTPADLVFTPWSGGRIELLDVSVENYDLRNMLPLHGYHFGDSEGEIIAVSIANYSLYLIDPLDP